MRRIAYIPARSGSKGIPKKNIRPLCGKPLMGWMIEAALKTLISESSTMEQKYEAIHSVVDRAVFDKANNQLDIHYRLIF